MFDILRRITWLEPNKTAKPLTDLGFRHGFLGINDAPPPMHHVQQIHSTIIAEAGDHTSVDASARIKADGIYTRQKGVTVAVKTADCLPVLFADKQGRLVMAVHAGWRGLTGGILQTAVNILKQELRQIDQVVACIGPAISLFHFEIGEDVMAALHYDSLGLTPKQSAFCLAKGRADRWHADLQTAAVLSLVNQGMMPQNLAVVQACTFKEAKTWHSYRREKAGFGQNWSYISC